MQDYILPADKLAALRAAHRQTRDKREADRIKAVVLLGTGWSAEQVAEVLQVDPKTVRNHFNICALLLPVCGSAVPGAIGRWARGQSRWGRRSQGAVRPRAAGAADGYRRS